MGNSFDEEDDNFTNSDGITSSDDDSPVILPSRPAWFNPEVMIAELENASVQMQRAPIVDAKISVLGVPHESHAHAAAASRLGFTAQSWPRMPRRALANKVRAHTCFVHLLCFPA